MNIQNHAKLQKPATSPLPWRKARIVTKEGVSIKLVDAAGEEVAVMRTANGRKEPNADMLLTAVNDAAPRMTAATFHNVLRILSSIDLPELQAVDLFTDGNNAGWKDFRDHPHAFFIRCDDETAAKIWQVVERRMAGRDGGK
jgi:hypothetical protein